jgi:hypothetical protein
MDGERPPSSSRRMFLSAGLGSVAAAMAWLVGRMSPVGAATGDPVVAGQGVESTDATRITRTTSGPVLMAEASGPGVGLVGRSEAGLGVYGIAATGHGVLGSSVSGSGVEAWSRDGAALHLRRGRFRADGISGALTIGAGETQASARVFARLSPEAFVLLSPASPLEGRDLWYELDHEERAMTVRVSTPVDEDVRVGWLVVG